MIQPITILFVILSAVFAAVHLVAVRASLYWHFWWFDILMHFWGGVLIALGVIAFTTFRRITLKPRLLLVLSVALVIVISWELFEWRVGLLVISEHSVDAIYDMLLGLLGSVVGYTVIKRYKKL